jgi:hypothetical protein
MLMECGWGAVVVATVCGWQGQAASWEQCVATTKEFGWQMDPGVECCWWQVLGILFRGVGGGNGDRDIMICFMT